MILFLQVSPETRLFPADNSLEKICVPRTPAAPTPVASQAMTVTAVIDPCVLVLQVTEAIL